MAVPKWFPKYLLGEITRLRNSASFYRTRFKGQPAERIAAKMAERREQKIRILVRAYESGTEQQMQRAWKVLLK